MSVISDKATLRRCLKQIVRNTEVVDYSLLFNPAQSGTDPNDFAERYLKTCSRLRERGSFCSVAETACISASNRMGFMDTPDEDATRSAAMYSKDAWIREILDLAIVKRAYYPVSLSNPESDAVQDERMQPMLQIGADDFSPGRFGIEYRMVADCIRSRVRAGGITHIRAEGLDEDALRYCIFPVCEEEKLILHIYLDTRQILEAFFRISESSGYIRGVLRTTSALQTDLIDRISGKNRYVLSLNGIEHLSEAVSQLHRNVIPFESFAQTMDELLGQWMIARDRIWPVLLEAYLPLARAGWTLTSEQLEQDIQGLFSDKWEQERTV